MTSSRSYEELVREVYIKPLRSVLIVDNDYPTWSEILTSENNDDTEQFYAQKGWKANPGPINTVISALRSSEGNLILDIDDGSNLGGDEPDQLVANLHQTDLLILDYQLDGADDGTKSIRILRDVHTNRNFNLVVVQTSASLNDAFSDMLLGLLKPFSADIAGDDISSGLELIERIELDRPDILETLRGAFGNEQYFAAYKGRCAALKAVFKGIQPFSLFKQICDECGWTGRQIRTLYNWAIADFQNRNEVRMHNADIDNISWSNEGVKWIRSTTAFVTFTNKREAGDIIGALQTGLVEWGPLPSRLLLSKLRKELDDHGSLAEDSALGNKHVLARWYLELLKQKDQKQKFLIEETINRHSEQLIAEVRPSVIEFSKALIAQDLDKIQAAPTEDPPELLTEHMLVKSYFDVDLGEQTQLTLAEMEHNAFICSTKPSGEHLRTGHVFKMGERYWVCLSPLCDLVPGQKTAGMYGEVGNLLPFLAVRLHTIDGKSLETKHNQIKDDIQSNRYIFLKENNEILILGLSKPGPKAHDANPHWYPLYADNQGQFKEEFKLRIRKVAPAKSVALKFEANDVEVFAQLRYEYALNLMQKLGASLNRVGLDFSG